MILFVNYVQIKLKMSFNQEIFRSISDKIDRDTMCSDMKQEYDLNINMSLYVTRLDAKEKNIKNNLKLKDIYKIYRDQNGRCAITNLPLQNCKPDFGSFGRWDQDINVLKIATQQNHDDPSRLLSDFLKRLCAVSLDRKDHNIGYTKGNVHFIIAKFNTIYNGFNNYTRRSWTAFCSLTKSADTSYEEDERMRQAFIDEIFRPWMSTEVNDPASHVIGYLRCLIENTKNLAHVIHVKHELTVDIISNLILHHNGRCAITNLPLKFHEFKGDDFWETFYNREDVQITKDIDELAIATNVLLNNNDDPSKINMNDRLNQLCSFSLARIDKSRGFTKDNIQFIIMSLSMFYCSRLLKLEEWAFLCGSEKYHDHQEGDVCYCQDDDDDEDE